MMGQRLHRLDLSKAASRLRGVGKVPFLDKIFCAGGLIQDRATNRSQVKFQQVGHSHDLIIPDRKQGILRVNLTAMVR
jgi:hypothetical protein